MLGKWRESRAKNLCDVTIFYKLTKFKKVEVDLILIELCYNKGERQKGTHQRTSLSTAAFTVKTHSRLERCSNPSDVETLGLTEC